MAVRKKSVTRKSTRNKAVREPGSARNFDVDSVRQQDLAVVAALSSSE